MNKKQAKRLYNVVVACLLLAAIAWVCMRFMHLGTVAFTDNAQVKQQIVPVSTRVPGFIKKIYVSEFEEVKKGDTLVVIEDSEFRYQLAQAEANLYNALTAKKAMGTTIKTTQSNIGVTEAGIEESRVRMQNALTEYKRYEQLLAQKAVTKQQFDAIKTNYEAAKARYNQLSRQKESTTLVKDEQTLRLEQNEAGVRLAQAALNLARLNLSYTVITAPCDGVTGRKEIEEGQLVQPGQTLINVVNSSEKWVVANYKETQTAHIQVGDKVEVAVDAVPNVVYKGVVTAISAATGASYSLFPQDNSAGNFVKVEQRIPVRIDFTQENTAESMQQLRSGMNVECEVLY